MQNPWDPTNVCPLNANERLPCDCANVIGNLGFNESTIEREIFKKTLSIPRILEHDYYEWRLCESKVFRIFTPRDGAHL